MHLSPRRVQSRGRSPVRSDVKMLQDDCCGRDRQPHLACRTMFRCRGLRTLRVKNDGRFPADCPDLRRRVGEGERLDVFRYIGILRCLTGGGDRRQAESAGLAFVHNIQSLSGRDVPEVNWSRRRLKNFLIGD